MSSKILRALARLDDLAEIAVLSLFGFLRTRRGLMVAGLIGLAWIAKPTPPADMPALIAPEDVPGMTAQDLEDELRALDIDDDRILSVQPVRFEVESVTGSHPEHGAIVRWQGRTYPVRAGSLIPSDGAPSFVVTRVDCSTVEAYDWNAHRSVTIREARRAGPSGPAEVRFRLSALAGDDPDPVGVLEYRGENFIVHRGSRVPDCGDSAFEVLDLSKQTIILRDLWTGQKIRRSLAIE